MAECHRLYISWIDAKVNFCHQKNDFSEKYSFLMFLKMIKKIENNLIIWKFLMSQMFIYDVEIFFYVPN